MPTIRQQIIDTIQARFEGITVVNGYQTDIGLNVTSWKETPWDEGIYSGVDVRDPDCTGSADVFPAHTFKLTVKATAFAKVGAGTVDEIRDKTLSDINKAIGIDPSWGGLAINTEPPTDSIIIEHKDKIIGGCEVTFVVQYRTKAWDPNTKM